MNTLFRKNTLKLLKILIYFSVLEVQKVEKWKMYMEIHQLLNQGFNKTQVAKKLNISRTTVYRYLEKNPESDRKSTRLNSSHVAISYAVFCLKKKKGEE